MIIGFNIYVREMRISFFIDESDKLFHFNGGGFDYDLSKDEVDLINRLGGSALIDKVKELEPLHHFILENKCKIMRFV